MVSGHAPRRNKTAGQEVELSVSVEPTGQLSCSCWERVDAALSG